MVRLRAFVVSLVLAVFAASASAGPVLPAKDGGNSFATYSLGYTTVAGQQELYLYTGNSIYRLDGGSFSPQISGLRGTTYFPSTRASDLGLGLGPNGQALAMMGQGGGEVVVDLNTGPIGAEAAPQVDSTPPGYTDNFFSAASRQAGRFYAMYVAPDFSTNTAIYSMTTGVGGTTAFVVDPPVASPNGAPFNFSGGMAFDSSGNLIIGVLSYVDFSTYPIAQANFYRIIGADLDAFESSSATPAVEYLGGGSANGNGAMAVDAAGNIFFNTATGIGMFRNGQITSIYGNVLATNFPATNLVEGLAYEPSTNSLVFAQFVTDHYELNTLAVPEPASVIGLMIGSAVLLRRRYRTR